MRLGDLATVRHAIGALLLVPHWPSRRMIRRLQAENAELRRAERELRGCADLAAACSKAVLQRTAQL